MRFCKLVIYDIKNGIGRNIPLYAVTWMLCIIFVSAFYFHISQVKNPSQGAEACTITNILFYLFQGKEPFSPELGNAFVFPVIWLCIFLFSAYLTLDYPYRNLTGHGIYIITRIGSRAYWWLSKCIFVFCSTLLYFFIWYFITGLFCMIFGIPISLRFAESINVDFLHMELAAVTQKQVIMLLVGLPILTSLAVNFIQLCLGLFVDRIYCFLITAILLFASTYFQTPLLLGNYAMVKRSVFCVEDGMKIGWGLLVTASLIAVCILTGVWRMKKYDILKKNM